MRVTAGAEEEVPVLIAGGGGAGLTGAIAERSTPAGADGGDGVLRRLRGPRPGLRAPACAPGVLGRRRGGRELAGGEPVAAAEPAADPAGAAAEGPGGGALAGADPVRP